MPIRPIGLGIKKSAALSALSPIAVATRRVHSRAVVALDFPRRPLAQNLTSTTSQSTQIRSNMSNSASQPFPEPQLPESLAGLTTKPKLHLYTAGTPNGHKASIILEELVLAYPELAKDKLSYDFYALSFGNNDQKSERFLKINPNGRIPALVDDNFGGHAVFETMSILIWLVEVSRVSSSSVDIMQDAMCLGEVHMKQDEEGKPVISECGVQRRSCLPLQCHLPGKTSVIAFKSDGRLDAQAAVRAHPLHQDVEQKAVADGEVELPIEIDDTLSCETGESLRGAVRMIGYLRDAPKTDKIRRITILKRNSGLQTRSFAPRLSPGRYAPEKIPYGIKRYQDETKRLYSVLEDGLKLGKGEWLVGDKYSIVDIACFGWVRRGAWAGVDDMSPYPLLKAWVDRIEARQGAYNGVGIPNRPKPDTQKSKEDEEKEAKEAAKWVMGGQPK